MGEPQDACMERDSFRYRVSRLLTKHKRGWSTRAKNWLQHAKTSNHLLCRSIYRAVRTVRRDQVTICYFSNVLRAMHIMFFPALLQSIACDQLPLCIDHSQTFINFVFNLICHCKAFYNYKFPCINSYSTNGISYVNLRVCHVFA